jgi:RNA polymerase sigma-70 factor (family 1)
MDTNSICEEQVFLEIHKEQSLPLRNFLFYRLGSLEKAKDFVQEAFITLWENCSKVSFDKAKSYLFTIANRKFLDETSHQKVVLKFERRMSIKEAQMEENPEYIYREEEFKERLEEVVSELPEKQRAVFLLSRIDKMKNKEIAELLDISIKTVEKHLSNSLKSLKEKLDELGDFKI